MKKMFLCGLGLIICSIFFLGRLAASSSVSSVIAKECVIVQYGPESSGLFVYTGGIQNGRPVFQLVGPNGAVLDRNYVSAMIKDNDLAWVFHYSWPGSATYYGYFLDEGYFNCLPDDKVIALRDYDSDELTSDFMYRATPGLMCLPVAKALLDNSMRYGTIEGVGSYGECLRRVVAEHPTATIAQYEDVRMSCVYDEIDGGSVYDLEDEGWISCNRTAHVLLPGIGQPFGAWTSSTISGVCVEKSDIGYDCTTSMHDTASTFGECVQHVYDRYPGKLDSQIQWNSVSRECNTTATACAEVPASGMVSCQRPVCEATEGDLMKGALLPPMKSTSTFLDCAEQVAGKNITASAVQWNKSSGTCVGRTGADVQLVNGDGTYLVCLMDFCDESENGLEPPAGIPLTVTGVNTDDHFGTCTSFVGQAYPMANYIESALSTTVDGQATCTAHFVLPQDELNRQDSSRSCRSRLARVVAAVDLSQWEDRAENLPDIDACSSYVESSHPLAEAASYSAKTKDCLAVPKMEYPDASTRGRVAAWDTVVLHQRITDPDIPTEPPSATVDPTLPTAAPPPTTAAETRTPKSRRAAFIGISVGAVCIILGIGSFTYCRCKDRRKGAEFNWDDYQPEVLPDADKPPRDAYPDYATHVPDYSTRVPNYSTRVPDYSTRVPDYATHVPDYSTRVPNYSTRVPDYSTRVPNYSTQYSTAPPNYSAAVPNGYNQSPSGSMGSANYSYGMPAHPPYAQHGNYHATPPYNHYMVHGNCQYSQKPRYT